MTAKANKGRGGVSASPALRLPCTQERRPYSSLCTLLFSSIFLFLFYYIFCFDSSFDQVT